MATPFKVKALYEYASDFDDELHFPLGQIITVTAEEDEEWYTGEYVDQDGTTKEGIFPRNFVEKFEPTAPPRPARTRPKKDPESEPPPPQPAEPEAPVPPPAPQADEPPTTAEDTRTEEEERSTGEFIQESPPVAQPEPPASIPAPAPVPTVAPKAAGQPPPDSTASAAPKPKPKAAPPPVSEKPKSNAFRDRIAAFNKPDSAPVVPFKPSGNSSAFIKKPFVAPPPSRDAFVPPPREAAAPKTYRREEDPEIKDREVETQKQAEQVGLVPTETQAGEEGDQPQPKSLKERIALLQKQQMEQAQRNADAAAKKEKPKKPAKRATEPAAAADAPEDEGAEEEETLSQAAPARRSTDDTGARTSTDDGRTARAPPPPRRKSTKGPIEMVNDGNEADMSGAGDTTEGHDDTTERDDTEEPPRQISRAPTGAFAEARPDSDEDEEKGGNGEEEEEDEDDVDPEVRRKEELRARMAKMSGGMGFHGMFGAPPGAPAVPKKKKSKVDAPVDEGADEEPTSPRGAPPIPTPMALPGFGGMRKQEEPAATEDEPKTTSRAAPPVPRRSTDRMEPAEEDVEEEDEDDVPTPAPRLVPAVPPRDGAPPPVPGGRPAPPPIPVDSRPPPPTAPPKDVRSATDGSESDDELSGRDRTADNTDSGAPKSPSLPPQPPQRISTLPPSSPPLSPRGDEFSPSSPPAPSKRNSRPPPPIPGAAPPPPVQTRPPPPPPPGSLSRQSTAEAQAPRQPQAGEENEDEATEYEGDYDTDIGSSVPHKDALKAHARDSSLEDNSLQSPISDAPPKLPPAIPTSPAPRGVPPPLPSQPPPPPTDSRRLSVDVPPRAAPPPPPPPGKPQDDEYDPYNYGSPPAGTQGSSYTHKTPRIEEEAYFPNQPQVQSPPVPVQSPGERRPPPPPGSGRPAPRQSSEVPRASMSNRRSMDTHNPSAESGFIANDLDLAVQSGWWKQSNQVPPVLQGRRDIYFECDESTSTNRGEKTIVTREVTVLFQDYSQTVLTARYDPYNPADVELDQRHEPPPRVLRQDQMEEFWERFGRPISDAVSSKKDAIVGDGTPQGLVFELLRPFKDALPPVGTRAYGALVYANMANASTQLHDVIRPGDILSIRNAKFQGKHGAMHAKYSTEVGKPDHVAVVAEWDGTKKKVRAWEQGRESKKVKVESFKLDDLRSGEVKIWRIMPRSWVGWNSQH